MPYRDNYFVLLLLRYQLRRKIMVFIFSQNSNFQKSLGCMGKNNSQYLNLGAAFEGKSIYPNNISTV